MSMPLSLQGQPVVVGGGLAGLLVAVALAPAPCVVISKAPFGTEASSAWAQGGIAAAMGSGDDPGQHLADTLSAGDGLCDPEAASAILRAGPEAVERLARLGARFDRDAEGRLRLGREAAHGRPRIVHAFGDGTGREALRAALVAARARPSISLIEGVEARRLLVEDGRVAGLLAAGPGGPLVFATGRVVLATGSLAGLYDHGTSPRGAWGSGLAMAARAGAALRDAEFVQFHPTALDVASERGGAPLPLVSEAVRGDGAVLVDERGTRFMAGVPGEELAPRDVVARAVWRHRAAGHSTFLDARAALGSRFAERFPTVAGLCAAAGIDPAREPIPVRPAAHYAMGGVAVDARGRSTLPGLWACGEVAATGLHGANRLASNSLLEVLVCAPPVAADVGGQGAGPARAPRAPAPPPRPDPAPVRPILSAAAGVERDGAGLARAAAALLPLARGGGPAADPAAAALFVVAGALARAESRGAHHRRDAPEPDAAQARSRSLTLAEAIAVAEAHILEEA